MHSTVEAFDVLNCWECSTEQTNVSRFYESVELLDEVCSKGVDGELKGASRKSQTIKKIVTL